MIIRSKNHYIKFINSIPYHREFVKPEYIRYSFITSIKSIRKGGPYTYYQIASTQMPAAMHKGNWLLKLIKTVLHDNKS